MLLDYGELVGPDAPPDLGRGIESTRKRLWDLDSRYGEHSAGEGSGSHPRDDGSPGLPTLRRGAARQAAVTGGVRCIIYDSCDYFAAGLADALRASAGAAVRRVADRAQLAEQVRRFRPDVVIASLEPPSEACKVVRSVPNVPVLVMSWTLQEDQAFDIFRAGASAFAHKETSVSDLLATIDNVIRGSTIPLDCRSSSGGPTVRNRATTSSRLTPREHEIVDLLAVGLSNVQIARQMGIAHQTVKNHLHNAMRRSGVSSRLALLVQTRAQGGAVFGHLDAEVGPALAPDAIPALRDHDRGDLTARCN
ncbi:MAG: LuxR C-terminal-related transcriptional regulator [Acidimicrobiales bacterium]